MAASHAPGADPIKVGVIADQTGPLSFVGLANANVARMVIGDINAKGGLLGRHAGAVPRGQRDGRRRRGRARRPSWSSTTTSTSSSAASTARRGRPSRSRPSSKGKTLYIYPEQYEGQESDPLIFCTGPVPAQQVDPFIPWLMRETGAKTFYLPSADYIWPHVMNAARARGRHGQRRRDRRRGVLPARPHGLPRDGRADRRERRRRRVQHDRAARRRAVLRAAARLRLHEPRRPARLHVLRRELPEHGAGRARRRGCTAASTTTRPSSDPFSQKLLAQYDALYPGAREVHRRQRLLGPVPRAAPVGGRRDRGGLARAGRT